MDYSTVEIISRDGRRRRMRKGEALQDGETMSIPPRMAFFDGREVADYLTTKYSPAVHVVDAAGIRAGHRPGYLFDHALDRLQDIADRAYEGRCRHLDYRTKPKVDEEEEEDGNESEAERRKRIARKLAATHMGLDNHALDQAATDAYEQKRQRLADAWRH